MDSSVCIVLMVILILCFALLLAWLAAKNEDPNCVKLTMLPPEQPERGCAEVKIETSDSCVILSLQALPTEKSKEAFSHPAPADGADSE
jgi:hypothetical protein